MQFDLFMIILYFSDHFDIIFILTNFQKIKPQRERKKSKNKNKK
jgi:hypothetical protein